MTMIKFIGSLSVWQLILLGTAATFLLHRIVLLICPNTIERKTSALIAVISADVVFTALIMLYFLNQLNLKSYVSV